MNASTHLRFATRCRRGIAALLLIIAGTATAHADAVYKCRDARGQIAYQDHACADPAQETRIEIAPAPPPAASPDYAIEAVMRPSRRQAGMRNAKTRRDHIDAVSYECRAANGEVFYKHSGCPKSITVATANERHGAKGRKSAARGPATHPVAVSARPLARSEACKRMASGGSVGRAGREHDDAVSTYDRNAGRDPCRHS